MSENEPAYNYCALPLAAFATRPDQSRGRQHVEPESRHRTPFQRDRDRIIHSAAFRRLKYKTQVFVYHEGDHYRTRLTHTLEVAQIARTLARVLQVNEDLAETVALSHDLGHTPFAHIGGDTLDACMEQYGGFDHNDQSLRVLTLLEHKYPRWKGLNLTWETLEGVTKHNGPQTGKLPITITELNKVYNLQLDKYASLEAQIAGLSDDIAYNNHDVEDGLFAGLFTLEQLSEVPLFGATLNSVRARYGDLEKNLLIQETIRDVIGMMVEDVLVETKKRLNEVRPTEADAIREAGSAMVAFSDAMEKHVKELRKFLFDNMYRHYTVNRMTGKAEQIVRDLFGGFMLRTDLLPTETRNDVLAVGDNKAARARIICDYIASMTDRSATREHHSIYDLMWDIR